MNQQEFEILSREYPEVRAVVRFVSPSYRNQGFWRFKRDRSKALTVAEMRHRLAFIRANFDVYGKRGLTPVNGILMPQGAKSVQDQLRGKRFTEFSASEKRVQLARKRLERTLPRLSQKEAWKQFEKKWDYYKKRAEYDMRTVKGWRLRVPSHL